jgi:membrane protein
MPAEAIGERAETWAAARSARMGRCNPWHIAVRTVRASLEDRVSGLAAEMAFFALLSLLPALVAIGAALGLLERVLDPATVQTGRAAAIEALGAVFSPQVTAEVMEPLVDGLLRSDRGGIAVSGLIGALWLASRVFTAAIRALDLAYNVEERRGVVVQRLLAMVFAVGAVVVVSLTLVIAVVGPLFGTGADIAGRVGLGDAFAVLWQLLRWPVIFGVAVGFFTAVYRFGPNVDNRMRDSLPGALLGVSLWLLVSFGFRLYLATVGGPGDQFIGDEDETVALLGQAVGAIVAAILWTFLSSVALLVGGELNAELAAARGRTGPCDPEEAVSAAGAPRTA